MNTRQRTRARTDRFELRGWVYPFHEIRDQGKMAALVPETDEPRELYLFGRAEPVEIRKGDIAIIYPQIGWPLPASMVSPVQTASVALERAAAAVSAFKASAAEPSAPVSQVGDEPPEPKPEKVPPLLLPYIRVGETVSEAVSRLNADLLIEADGLINDVLHGAGARVITEGEHAGKTVSIRHGEVSALLSELAQLGAAAEVSGG